MKRGIYSNEKLLTKAAITSASFAGGLGLTTEESDRFIDFVIDESGLKDRTRVVRMNKATVNIDKLALGSEKVLVPAKAAVDPGETVSHTNTQITLTGKEMIAVVRISDDALEDNIEGEAFADHLMRMVASAASNQLEDALLYGRKEADLDEQDDVTQLWEGWISQAETGGHIVDANAGFADRFISREKLSKLLKSLPTKFRKNRRNLNYVMSDDLRQDYIDTQAVRETGLGDSASEQNRDPRYGGIDFAPSGLVRIDRPLPVVGGGDSTVDGDQAKGTTNVLVASSADFAPGDFATFDFGGPREESHAVTAVPDGTHVTIGAPGLRFNQLDGAIVKEVTLDASDVLLTDFRNLIWGIQRDVRIETDRLPRLRATDWVLTMRMDAQVENTDALALLKNAESK